MMSQGMLGESQEEVDHALGCNLLACGQLVRDSDMSGVTATVHCQVESERVLGGLVLVTEMEVVIVFVFVL